MIQVVRHHEDFGGAKVLESWFLQNVAESGVPANVLRIRVLLSVGFDMYMVPGTDSAMDMAIQSGNLERVAVFQELAALNGAQCCKCSSRTANGHLQNAAKNADVAQAAAALEAGANPSLPESWSTHKRTPLHFFAAVGDLDICRRLIACNASVQQIDTFRCNALHYARVFGYEHIEEYLRSTAKSVTELGMKAGQDINQFVLDAVQAGCCGAFWLAREFCDENGSKAFETALNQTVGPFQNSLLHMAVDITVEVDPSGSVAKALLALRANPLKKNSRATSPLHNAAYAGHRGLYEHMMRIVEVSDKGSEELKSFEEIEGHSFARGSRMVLERNAKKNEEKQKGSQRNRSANKKEQAENALMMKVGFFAFRHALLQSTLNQANQGGKSIMDILDATQLKKDAGDSDDSMKADGSGSEGGRSKASKASKASKRSKCSKASKASKMSKGSKMSRASFVSASARSASASSVGGKSRTKGKAKPRSKKNGAGGSKEDNKSQKNKSQDAADSGQDNSEENPSGTYLSEGSLKDLRSSVSSASSLLQPPKTSLQVPRKKTS
jgi:hypothetical protein